MATIDYKEKYEKAVQAAMLAKQDTESAVTIGILEEIFPELRESEDERIRKELIAFIKKQEGQTLPNNGETWIAWIEKQGEQKPAEPILSKEVDSQIWQIANNAGITYDQSISLLMATKKAYDKGKEDAIKEQKHWKPSVEQMKALNKAMYHVDDSVATQIAMLIGELSKL